jgi:hypothetical protein
MDAGGFNLEKAFIEFCKEVFYPILAPVFHPINDALAHVYQPYASICAVGLFVIAMFIVGVMINEKYVNRGRPNQSIWTDLRVWTVLCMTPHVIVYFYFR